MPTKTKYGTWQVDFQDARAGIPRTRRNFDTRKEAAEFERELKAGAHARLLGRSERHLFGEALTKYLTGESQQKRTHGDDKSNASALRQPFWSGERRAWCWLEEAPLTDEHDGIVALMADWLTDQRGVQQRRYINDELYHLRREGAQLTWYRLDTSPGKPEPRKPVTDPRLIAKLGAQHTLPASRVDHESGEVVQSTRTAASGRGAFSDSTLRVRIALVRRILRLAWRTWRWVDVNLADLVDTVSPAEGVEFPYDYALLLRLICAAPTGFDDAILAASLCGWRRSPLLGRNAHRNRRAIEGLTWSRVEFPIYRDGHLLRAGRIWYESASSKNKREHSYPMGQDLEALLRSRWDARNGALVFHRGNGKGWNQFDGLWKSVKVKAGAPADMRWHDLRHCWAGMMVVEAGASDRELQQLGNWKDARMPARYANINTRQLLDVVDKRRRKDP